MFHLEPVGEHMVEVCTNVSCALVGAQQVLEAFEAELGIRAGETTEDGEVTLRAVECLGGCGWATVVAVDHRYRLARRSRRTSPAIVEELRWRAAAARPRRRRRARPDEARRVPRDRRLHARSRRRARWRRTQLIEELKASNLRGRGGAFFPIGRKGASLIEARPARSRTTSSSTPTSRSRALQGPRDHARASRTGSSRAA